ncbi:hypothetical protein RclHR1_06370007 [Rhizophagus clarus]|uniref:Uncharacterized protein n=1 Tax=Rhizophagus clarus TaxID=94130 RepID=A0A2Z6S8H6_9GLOM|nr:hypothetical protein RclHR1_06370007 [Rhizophagus clarus]
MDQWAKIVIIRFTVDYQIVFNCEVVLCHADIQIIPARVLQREESGDNDKMEYNDGDVKKCKGIINLVLFFILH